MQALSMIDMGAKAPEAVVPGKPVKPDGQEFATVLGEQQRPEGLSPADARSQQSAKWPEAAKPAKAEAAPEEKPAVTAKADEAEVESAPQAVAAEVVKAVAQAVPKELVTEELVTEELVIRAAEVVMADQVRTAGQGNIVQQPLPQRQEAQTDLLSKMVEGETPKVGEQFNTMEELLTHLLQQLDSTELPSEQVLAGVDLSALAKQLEQIASMPANPGQQGGIELQNGDKPLKQLVNQLAAQLVRETQQSANPESSANQKLIVGMLPVVEQQTTTALPETLEQARQVLQKAIDSVTAQRDAGNQLKPQPVAVAEQPVEQDLLLTEPSAEQIDPRFAGLLKPRAEARLNQQPALSERVRGVLPQQPNVQPDQSSETEPAVAELVPDQAKAVDFAELLGNRPPQTLENLAQQAQGNQQPVGAQASLNPGNTRLMPDAVPVVQLPSGQQVAESQIFDQVVTRFSGSFNGDSGRMVLRLQPAELGSLKLELVVEGDRVSANLQAQSQQVQEVLERNLPQLRHALAEQGLKIDQFQVDVNQQKDPDQKGQFGSQAQQQQQKGSQQQAVWNQAWQQSEEQVVPLAHLMQNGGGGISLHV